MTSPVRDPEVTSVPKGEDMAEPKPLRCRACGHAITSAADRVRIADKHEHRFLNPHGFVFDIGCFRRAPGCRLLGEPSHEFSWFPPLAWRMADCGACGDHLGWGFDAPGQVVFFGLVLNRLVGP